MKDNFSTQAALYVKYRPAYPGELVDFILSHTSSREAAWDCATGNGQTAKHLAEHFKTVFATDISQNQIDQAAGSPNIYYSLQPAEQTSFPDNSFDLVTVSQALHWFEFDSFYKEVKRVAKPGSVFAAWCYSLFNVDPSMDRLVRTYYKDVLGTYWDAERKLVDEEYKTIPFPFPEITSPQFSMKYDWTLEELEGYLNTWSALQKFIAANQYNPVDELIKKIKPYYCNNVKLQISFPLHVRIGRIEK